MDLQTLQRFEIRELIYFVALAEELHLGRAAERVGIQESPLSRAISSMERKLGVRLFVRTRKGTRLSPTGEALLPIARQMLTDAEQAHQVLHAAASGRQGRLRVAFCENVASPRIAALMKQSREEDTDVDLSFEQRSLPDQVTRLRSGMIDIGLAASASDEPIGTDADIDALVLSRDPLMLAMPARHPLAAQAVVQDLHENMGPFVLIDCCPADAGMIGELVKPSGTSSRRVEFVASVGMLLTRVASGDGMGLISAVQAQAIARPDIAFRPLESRRARMTTYLLRRHADESALATRFTQRARRLHIRSSPSLSSNRAFDLGL